MSNSSWNAPTGPPNGAPVRPGDARREIDEAIQHARSRDSELRAEVVAAASARVRASDLLGAATDEAGEALTLAKRALTRSNESARAGQRADAAKWTAAAQVFAMRLRDARAEVAALEGHVAAASDQAERAEQALAENVGRLQAVVAARLPTLSGRKAGRARRDVDDVVEAISAPTTDLVTQATVAVRAAVDSDEPPSAADAAGVPMSDDDLESAVDFESTDTILAELRAELDLPAPSDPASTGTTSSGNASSSSPSVGVRGQGTAPKAKGKATSGRSWSLPVRR